MYRGGGTEVDFNNLVLRGIEGKITMLDSGGGRRGRNNFWVELMGSSKNRGLKK